MRNIFITFLGRTLFFSFLGISIGCGQNVKGIKELQSFETEVDSLMKVYHTVGASVAIIKEGRVIYTNGFGYRDLDNKIPANEHTIFGIGSCTKAFTASLFGVLEEQGKLSLQDKPSQHIPSLSFYNSDMNDGIQIKHILSHSTGIPQLSTECSAVFFRSDDKNDIIPRLKYLQPQSEIGEEWIYSNYLYALAGRITEHVTNQSWQKNLSNYIFEPLEMKNSYGNVVPASKHPEFSLGYGVLDTVPMQVLPENIPTRDAGGNIYSSVTDMSHWLSVWLNQGQFKNKTILPKDYLDNAMGKQQLMNTDSITNISQYYGYGWMRTQQEGHLKIEHSGGVSGYTSNITFFPEDGLGIIVLTNQNTAGIAFAITNNIITRFLGYNIPSHQNEPFYSRIIPLEDPQTDTVINKEKPPTHALEDFNGSFFHPGYGKVDVYFEDNTLYAKFPFTTFRLEHQNDNIFYDYFTVRKSQVVGNFLRFDFQANNLGYIDRLLLNVDNEPVTFMKE